MLLSPVQTLHERRVIFFSPSGRPHGLLRDYRRSDDPSNPGHNLQWTRSVRTRLVARERYCLLAGAMRVGKHRCVDCVSPATLYRYLPAAGTASSRSP